MISGRRGRTEKVYEQTWMPGIRTAAARPSRNLLELVPADGYCAEFSTCLHENCFSLAPFDAFESFVLSNWKPKKWFFLIRLSHGFNFFLCKFSNLYSIYLQPMISNSILCFLEEKNSFDGVSTNKKHSKNIFETNLTSKSTNQPPSPWLSDIKLRKTIGSRQIQVQLVKC